MAYTQTLEALILRVIDIGEADRFCILFTRERGKIAVRARGVRKLKSVMGAYLLPLQHVSTDVKESRSGWIAAGVRPLGAGCSYTNLHAFACMQEGVELLFHLLHDDEPLPDVFDSTLELMRTCHRDSQATVVLAFTIRVLHLLGLLPEDDAVHFQKCTPEEMCFVQRARAGSFTHLPSLVHNERLRHITLLFIQDQTSAKFRAGDITPYLISAPLT
ncbi:hypothetical protein COU77_01360 [Candidatus Peregrinibacteria bacterium CG10_big_fil_rev_8_21_14_0_10_49_16]|nr:MAG: hypothetical protein COW95_01290 [Candidatus Peregrinibacteria bacterium CG22_combo_CG10-13_8_21_14_all_49_11]PIR52258.1 MAG: hypothetical protein COU77_01360 [Candidatus Peregrinibacteria bacterium CG10_big_fil_rev_8_21_14_0_10_49_16]